MTRGWSGAILRADGTLFAGSVTLPDTRTGNLRQLLLDLSRPGLCIVLGAGAFHGVTPLTTREIANIALKMLRSQSNFQALSSAERQTLSQHPEVMYLTNILRTIPTSAWDRALLDLVSPGQATLILNDIFTPRGQVPAPLIDIYKVLENKNGVIVSYNYDRIAERQSSFPVIAPHGQNSALLLDPQFGDTLRNIAQEMHIAVPTDWHLPVPEHEQVRLRTHYQDMLCAWRCACSVVFVGYGFGGGADALSFQDFAVSVAKSAHIHVLCPPPGNADLCKQIASVLRGRGAGFRVYGQPFRWHAFAEALLIVLRNLRAAHVGYALGKEAEIVRLHDRGPVGHG